MSEEDAVMPAPLHGGLAWKAVTQAGEVPGKRSGHSFEFVDGTGYMFGGVCPGKPPGPSGDTYKAVVSGTKCTWSKLETSGELPTPRWKHSAVSVDNRNLVIFGGFQDNTTRLNDVYFLNVTTGEWEEVGPTKASKETARAFIKKVKARPSGGSRRNLDDTNRTREMQESKMKEEAELPTLAALSDTMVSDGTPSPRGAHTAVVIGRNMYVFGGYGGSGYARQDFNDVYAFHLDHLAWNPELPNTVDGAPPARRSGHTAFTKGTNMYIYGGWNTSQQFSDLHVFDTATVTWSEVETLSIAPPRWNHSTVVIPAVPAWQAFTFGGSVQEGADDDAEPAGSASMGRRLSRHRRRSSRTQGNYSNDIMSMEVDEGQATGKAMLWRHLDLVDDTEAPKPRADCAAQFDPKSKSLIVFGGWTDRWLEDMASLELSTVIGPPYAVSSSHPKVGPATGGTNLRITGMGFSTCLPTVPGPCTVRFSRGKRVVDVAGTVASDTEVEVEVPDVTAFGAGELTVRVAVGGNPMTITTTEFQAFRVTDPEASLVYGPGVMTAGFPCSPGVPTTFVIQSRNTLLEERQSGEDPWVVNVMPADGGAGEPIDVEVKDMGTGSYEVRYTAPAPGKYIVDVALSGSGKLPSAPFTVEFEDAAPPENNALTGRQFLENVRHVVKSLSAWGKTALSTLKSNVPEDDMETMLKVKEQLQEVESSKANTRVAIDSALKSLSVLSASKVHPKKELDKLSKLLESSTRSWESSLQQAPIAKAVIQPLVKKHATTTKTAIAEFEAHVESYVKSVDTYPFWKHDIGVEAAMASLQEAQEAQDAETKEVEQFGYLADMFEFPTYITNARAMLADVQTELDLIKHLWSLDVELDQFVASVNEETFGGIDAEKMEDDGKALHKKLKQGMTRRMRESGVYKSLDKKIRDFLSTCPLLASLTHPAMCDRHWDLLMKATGTSFTPSPDMKIEALLALNLHNYSADVEEITDQAVKERNMEQGLAKLEEAWSTVEFIKEPAKEGSDVMTLKLSEEDFEMLEADQLVVQGFMSSRFMATFEESITTWQRDLAGVSEVVLILGDIQRTWSYLEPLFMSSEEVKKELPETAAEFAIVDAEVKTLLAKAGAVMNVRKACNEDGLMARLDTVSTQLEKCKKALVDFLDGKRRLFPRFYFVSEADLLDILSNGSAPSRIVHHITKVLLATATIEIENVPGEGRPIATRYVSCVGVESVDLSPPVALKGKVECYLQDVLDAQHNSLRGAIKTSLARYGAQTRVEWLMDNDANGRPTDPAQIMLLVSGLAYVKDVEDTFAEMASGNTEAMKTQQQKLINDLSDLIRLTQTKLDRANRQRVMSMITIDAHSRDVVARLLRENVTEKDAFQWQSQLKHRFDGEHARVAILDASLQSGYEYLGNGPRLVITPLTDRIYVTATQALNLKMGCAPAGPAGTGKTETTKDLASAVAKCCYVFNCSPEMDYQSMGNIFKGLAASGSWGCFDEFNRLVPEVLSVCSVQFKAVCDAIRLGREHATIEGDDVKLDPTCGAFITMNPGYIGRAELPEGLKALFRPMTVMVPDLVLICENMLMAEGFIEAKVLASKFYGLYSLLRELLSKQSHYDWGLRAVKSVLVVAGGFKRAEPDLPEQALLMRALRDFNTPKIVQQDEVVFHGLLGDLFPNVNPPRMVDDQLEGAVQEATKANGLHADADFLLKVVQLQELLAIRHCVFVMGPPGAGKTEAWRTLAAARGVIGETVKVVDLNPKSVSTEELYGYITLATREWKDGLLSRIMRDLGQDSSPGDKWILLDGDLDANWIESMNSVMDDNKTLTLASNERVPLKSNMRMLFEIRDLVYATPATVSRAGIIYISTDKGTQWRSLITSWVGRLEASDATKASLESFFKRYCADTLFYLKKECKPLVPLESMNLVTTLLRMLDCLLTPALLASVESSPDAARALESYFVFAGVWAFGCSMSEKDGENYRAVFSDYWRGEFTSVRMPSRETVFDYWLDPETLKFEPWKASPFFAPMPFDSNTQSMTEITVPTPETCSLTFWLQHLLNRSVPCMLVGLSGCGKTAIVKGLLQSQDPAELAHTTVNFNYFTNSAALQASLEAPLEKKMGTTFGPPGSGNMVYFLDDLNLPEVDPYNTQSAIALVRQHVDYGHWYDRVKLTSRTVINCQYLACLNPTAGSFEVNPRLQRHFATFAVGFPGPTSLHTIYNTFLNGHLQHFNEACQGAAGSLVNAALQLHAGVANTFRKSAVNFHYEFNIRHLSNVFQGLLVAQPAQFEDPNKLALLWLHESERVYGDRLVCGEDVAKYNKLAAAECKKRFPSCSVNNFFVPENPDPLVFCHFAQSVAEREYDQVTSMPALRGILEEALREHNEMHVTMDLVLFDDAVKHVCRIARIILNPAGHALLVGVGGSGKQSLSRLAAFICGCTVSQIVISGTYGLADLREDLKSMFMKAGVKEEGVMFLLTDSQVTNERFLVYINDLLSSGDVPDLFAQDEKDEVVSAVTARVKEAGLTPDAKTCWAFFLAEVRKNLHVVLSFSPVGDDFRTRAKRFPALVSCTVIDWFQPWPKEALLSVGKKFLSNVELGSEEVRAGVEAFLPYSFEVVNEMAKEFLTTDRRFVYTTPKSFLELLKLYKELLADKRHEMDASKSRLANGLGKLKDTAEAVSRIEEELKVSLEDAEVKRTTSEGIAAEVAANKEVVEAETAKATVEAEKCSKIQEDVSAMARDAEADLAKAEPAVAAAMAALDTLNKKDLGECKTMSTPPKGVDDVFAAVVVLLAGVDPNVIVQKSGKVRDKDRNWDAAKKALLTNVSAFIDTLKGYKAMVDAYKVPDVNWREVRPFLALEHFNSDTIMGKNRAAAGVCSWVINIVTYRDILVTVEPKREALRKANEELTAATEKLTVVQAHVADLQATLDSLTADLNAANAEKQEAIDTVARGQRKMELATRLTTALADERVRWLASVETLDREKDLLVGDVLLAAAFISYVGPFTKRYREALITDKYMPFLRKANIPMSDSPDPVGILTSEARVAEWNTQGLPFDRNSTENACIITSSARWPLLVDPQLQGIEWVREKEKANGLEVVRLGNKTMLSTLERAIDTGKPVIIENMGERVDAVLMPVVARATIKKGHKEYLTLGDKEVEMHKDFRLYLHTKLSNPHYPPEIQAETALVNFSVTEDGLGDQLLAMVVEKERPDLATLRKDLIAQQNEFKIKIKKLEDDILQRLAAAEGDLTEDVELIEGLEDTKRIAKDIAEKQIVAKKTETDINTTSEKYRLVAARGALLFFLMNDLFRVHTYYIYSLSAFVTIFLRAIDDVSGDADPMAAEGLYDDEDDEDDEAKLEEEEEEAKSIASEDAESKLGDDAAPEAAAGGEGAAAAAAGGARRRGLSDEDLERRCTILMDSVTNVVFQYINRGLFEQDKLTVATQMCFKILLSDGEVDPAALDVLSNSPLDPYPGTPGPLSEWMPEVMWAKVKALEVVKELSKLGDTMQDSPEAWEAWFDAAQPEAMACPAPYKDLSALLKLLLLRAMRPDRLPAALTAFLRTTMGPQYVSPPLFDMAETFKETDVNSPVFFVLFPGVDPTVWVEELGANLGFTIDNGKFINISMGQGQEKPAETAIEEFARDGGWVMLQNVHLMQSWLPTLERKLEVVAETAHPDFRCYISAEPPPFAYQKNMPESLMQSCIKVSQEAPADLRSNLTRAWACFGEDTIAACNKSEPFTACLFTLCFYHAIVLGRRRFGQQGWSKRYSFNAGDLTVCANVLTDYINANKDVPWDDLRYILGEIMYGGHITDAWDRRTNNTYLKLYFQPAILEGGELAPGFGCCDKAASYSQVAQYIEDKLPDESPPMFGLHPNAEIGYLTKYSNDLFQTIVALGGSSAGASGGGGGDSAVSAVLEGLLERLPEDFVLIEIKLRAEPLMTQPTESPYALVALQECERMNKLLQEVRRTLIELRKGLDGQLNMTEAMEDLVAALAINQVPGRNVFHKTSWEKLAWPSKKNLESWFQDMLLRVEQLERWTADMVPPYSLWLPGLFNPMSVVTAIMQVTSRNTGLPLDKMAIETHVTTLKGPHLATAHPENGRLVHGLFVEGARWEGSSAAGEAQVIGGVPCAGYLADSHLKELIPQLPLVYLRAVPVQPEWEPTEVGYLRHDPDLYECPVYTTTFRGPTFIFLSTLRCCAPGTAGTTSKWVQAGVCIVMQTDF